MKRFRASLVGTGIITILLAVVSGAVVAEGSVELPAGGLAFAANPSVTIEQQDLVIGSASIAVTYTLRNAAQSPQSIVVTFSLPELDASALADGEVTLPAAEPTNYIQFSPKVDGQAPAVKVEQRAIALGLDVSSTLTAAGIPLFPFGTTSASKLSDLSAADRLDLLERGILKEEGSAVVAAWTLKTVAYWRQTFAPGQTITIANSYRPISGAAPSRPEALPTLRKRFCLSTAQEAAIAKLPVEGGVAPTATSVAYLTTAGADQLGPARRFRMLIETNDQLTIVAMCRDGLKRTGPMQLEWTGTEHTLDEDMHILFVR